MLQALAAENLADAQLMVAIVSRNCYGKWSNRRSFWLSRSNHTAKLFLSTSVIDQCWSLSIDWDPRSQWSKIIGSSKAAAQRIADSFCTSGIVFFNRPLSRSGRVLSRITKGKYPGNHRYFLIGTDRSRIEYGWEIWRSHRISGSKSSWGSNRWPSIPNRFSLLTIKRKWACDSIFAAVAGTESAIPFLVSLFSRGITRRRATGRGTNCHWRRNPWRSISSGFLSFCIRKCVSVAWQRSSRILLIKSPWDGGKRRWNPAYTE